MGENERCDVCGFVWADISSEECPSRIRSAGSAFAELLESDPQASIARPSEGRWSANEYGCHVRDVLLNLRDRVVVGAVDDVPHPPGMNGTPRVEMGLYQGERPEVTAMELRMAADLFARTWERLPDDRRERMLVYGSPIGVPRNLTWVAAQAAHEAEHHLADARDGVRMLSEPGMKLGVNRETVGRVSRPGDSDVNIYGIEHVQLAMPPGRESEAIDFYQGVLGLSHVPKPQHLAVRGGCWFESGEVRIHLGVMEEFVPATKVHPALLVRSLPDLVSLLRQVAIDVTGDQPLDGFERCYAHDPFGNRIEFMQRTAG